MEQNIFSFQEINSNKLFPYLIKMIIKEEFIEYNKFSDDYYGTSKSEIEKIRRLNKVLIV